MPGRSMSTFSNRHWQAVLYARHLDNVRNAEPKVDATEPKKLPTADGNRKWQIEEARRETETKFQNQALVRNLEKILKAPPRPDLWNLEFDNERMQLAMQSNQVHETEQQQLQRENARMVKRLTHVRSQYSLEEAEKRYEQLQRHHRLRAVSDKLPFDVYFAEFQRKRRQKQRKEAERDGRSASVSVKAKAKAKAERRDEQSARRQALSGQNDMERLHSLVSEFREHSPQPDERADRVEELNDVLIRLLVKRLCAGRQAAHNSYSTRFGVDLFTHLAPLFSRPLKRYNSAETWSARGNEGEASAKKRRSRRKSRGRERKWVDDSRLSVKYATFFEAAFFDAESQTATELHDRLAACDAGALIRTFCTRDANASQALQRTYQKKYGTTVVEEIRASFGASGEVHSQFLSALVQGSGVANDSVDERLAVSDAYFLEEAGSVTNAVQVMADCVRRNGLRQFAALPRAYKRLTRVDWQTALNALPDSDAEASRQLLTSVSGAFKWANWSGMDSAELLHATMHPGSLEFVVNLFRLADIGALPVVRHAYKVRYGRDLAADVEQKCRGDTAPLLAALALRSRAKITVRRDSSTSRDRRSLERSRSPADQRDLDVAQVYSQKTPRAPPVNNLSPLRIPARDENARIDLLSDSPYLADGITKDTILRV